MHARTHAFTGRQTDIHANTHEKEIVARYKTHTDCDEPLRLDALCQRERASQTLLPLGAGPCGKIERFKGSKGRVTLTLTLPYRTLDPSTFWSIDAWIHRADLFSVRLERTERGEREREGRRKIDR